MLVYWKRTIFIFAKWIYCEVKRKKSWTRLIKPIAVALTVIALSSDFSFVFVKRLYVLCAAYFLCILNFFECHNLLFCMFSAVMLWVPCLSNVPGNLKYRVFYLLHLMNSWSYTFILALKDIMLWFAKACGINLKTLDFIENNVCCINFRSTHKC